MTTTELDALRHPSEQSRFWLTMIVVVPVIVAAVALAFATLGLALMAVVGVAVGLWLATRLAMARFLGNFVKVSEDNFPTIYAFVGECKEMFGYRRHVDVYVYENGTFNALLVPLLRRKVILLNSDVIANARSENEVRWIVGRFIGALASKHYRFSWLQAVISSIENILIFNVFLYPYERAVAKSGDQLGLFAIGGDVGSAVRATHKMMAGGLLGDRVSLAGVLGQYQVMGGSFFAWLAKCMSPFPHNAARVANLLRFAHERYPRELQAFVGDKDESTIALVMALVGNASGSVSAIPNPSLEAA